MITYLVRTNNELQIVGASNIVPEDVIAILTGELEQADVSTLVVTEGLGENDQVTYEITIDPDAVAALEAQAEVEAAKKLIDDKIKTQAQRRNLGLEIIDLIGAMNAENADALSATAFLQSADFQQIAVLLQNGFVTQARALIATVDVTGLFTQAQVAELLAFIDERLT